MLKLKTKEKNQTMITVHLAISITKTSQAHTKLTRVKIQGKNYL